MFWSKLQNIRGGVASVAYKPIFLIGKAYGANATIPKGVAGSKRLIRHSLRMAKISKDLVKAQVSNIDPSRTKYNLFFTSKTGEWRTFRDNEHRNQVLKAFDKKLQKVLEPFKQDFEKKKQYRIKEYRDQGRFTTFNEWMANKQPMSEWILSGSREWFERNQVIQVDPNDPKSFHVINHKKLSEWADTVQTWARGQVESFYGQDAFVMSNLHLDEGNVHIHFNFFRNVYKWNDKEKRMAWSFTNKDFLSREKMRTMQQSYRTFQNKVLFQDLHWDKTFSLERTQGGVKYLRLLEYKTAQAQKNLERVNHELEIQQWKSEKAHYRNNLELVKEAEKLLYRGMIANDPALVLAGHDILINLGMTESAIHAIQHEMERDL